MSISTTADVATLVVDRGSITIARTDLPDPYGERRETWRWTITFPTDAGGRFTASEADIRTGVGGQAEPEEMLATLLSFLTAAVESYPDGENADLFPMPVVKWADEHLTENQHAQIELDEEDE